MLPDGSVNPGEMTSFNHYALGSVADWMYRTGRCIVPLEPGLSTGSDRTASGSRLEWCETAIELPSGLSAFAGGSWGTWWRLRSTRQLRQSSDGRTSPTSNLPDMISDAQSLIQDSREAEAPSFSHVSSGISTSSRRGLHRSSPAGRSDQRRVDALVAVQRTGGRRGKRHVPGPVHRRAWRLRPQPAPPFPSRRHSDRPIVVSGRDRRTGRVEHAHPRAVASSIKRSAVRSTRVKRLWVKSTSGTLRGDISGHLRGLSTGRSASPNSPESRSSIRPATAPPDRRPRPKSTAFRVVKLQEIDRIDAKPRQALVEGSEHPIAVEPFRARLGVDFGGQHEPCGTPPERRWPRRCAAHCVRHHSRWTCQRFTGLENTRWTVRIADSLVVS